MPAGAAEASLRLHFPLRFLPPQEGGINPAPTSNKNNDWTGAARRAPTKIGSRIGGRAHRSAPLHRMVRWDEDGRDESRPYIKIIEENREEEAEEAPNSAGSVRGSLGVRSYF